MNIKITGTGSYIPKTVEKNEDFYNHEFLNADGSKINSTNKIIVDISLNIRNLKAEYSTISF